MYICKNLFYFKVEKYSTFGEKGCYLHFVPRHYPVKGIRQTNMKYRIENIPAEYGDIRGKLEQYLQDLEQYQEPQRTDIQFMLKMPK